LTQPEEHDIAKALSGGMSADFWAGYVSGAVGIAVGNPLDILKTRLQAGTSKPNIAVSTPAVLDPGAAPRSKVSRWTAGLRGAAAPILGYGALNALLFVTYNRSLALLTTGDLDQWPERPPSWAVFTAGALGGLATFFVSAPTELVKCRAQVSDPPQSSLAVTKHLWKNAGLRGLYLGGGITSVRDAVGYGF
jgi:solute carrier family 25 (mitochondrial carnitine/acylcarnitine transporter), member 20/29